MSSAISFDAAETPPFPVHRFTVKQYQRLGELGVLTPEDHVELIEGWIVEKTNHRPAHGYVVRLLNDWLRSQLSAGWLVQSQLPITTLRSEPEPDLAILRGQHADFRDRHPAGNECRLLIEVADSSLLKERAKANIYATAGVEEYWIVNLVDHQVEMYTHSDGACYRHSIIFTRDQIIEIRVGDETLRLPLDPLF